MMCLKIVGQVANSVDLDGMPQNVASHLHCLLRPVCCNIYGKYSKKVSGKYFSSSFTKTCCGLLIRSASSRHVVGTH